jgi:hypothetical protein
MNGKLNADKGTNMKSPLILASAVVLFVVAGVAHSQGIPQASQPQPFQGLFATNLVTWRPVQGRWA